MKYFIQTHWRTRPTTAYISTIMCLLLYSRRGKNSNWDELCEPRSSRSLTRLGSITLRHCLPFSFPEQIPRECPEKKGERGGDIFTRRWAEPLWGGGIRGGRRQEEKLTVEKGPPTPFLLCIYTFRYHLSPVLEETSEHKKAGGKSAHFSILSYDN